MTEEIRRYMPLVRSRAKRYAPLLRGYADYGDLLTCGMLAVSKAVETWREDGGASFGTHVGNHVNWAMLAEYGRATGPERGLRVPKLSIHPQTDDDLGIELKASTPDALHTLLLDKQNEATRAALLSLNPRYQDIIMARYFGEEQFKDIAARMGITKQAVHQLEVTALGKMRDFLCKRGEEQDWSEG